MEFFYEGSLNAFEKGKYECILYKFNCFESVFKKFYWTGYNCIDKK